MRLLQSRVVCGKHHASRRTHDGVQLFSLSKLLIGKDPSTAMINSCRISCRDLCLAIDSNSAGVVKEYLSRGGDPNVIVACETPIIDEYAIVRRKGFKPIHLAVVNCFRIVAVEDDGAWENAVSLVESLMEAGARLDAATSFVLRTCSDLSRGGGTRTDYTPLALALLLKKELNLCSGKSLIRLDVLLEKLLPSPNEAVQRLHTTVMVPESLVATYKKLLFSPDQSDIKFVCSDGEVFPAHKAILAATSPYFASAFTGPWTENSHHGEWKTSHSSSVIKALLTFVYTGDMDGSLVGKIPLDMLSIAGEYDIAPLKDLATAHCIESILQCVDSISLQHFKDMLQLAHLHGIDDLKAACFHFAERNATSVLTNADIMLLSTEDPALWDEFKSFITSKVTDTSKAVLK